MKKILCENYCSECESFVHSLIDEVDLVNEKLRPIKCKCDEIVMPCNECLHHDKCHECPYKNVEPVAEMDELSFLKFIKAEEPEMFKAYKNGDNGWEYKDIISNLEASGEL